MTENMKVTIDRIIIYEEPIQERHNLDAFLILKKKPIVQRRNYRAMVYIRETIPNRNYFVLTYVPGFFNLNPGDVISKARLTDLENKHREKVSQWVETANSRFIITQPSCDCNAENVKINTFTIRNVGQTSTTVKNPDTQTTIKNKEN